MKKNGKFICNRCGKVIDIEHDLDCVETKMFVQRNICTAIPDDDIGKQFARTDNHTKLHFCGKCNDMLQYYVWGCETKTQPIAEEIIRCRDCVKYFRHDCPMSFIEKQEMCFIDRRADFFCGHAERKEDTDE